MGLTLGRPIGVSLLLSLFLATLSGKQARTSGSSVTAAVRFPVEETTIAQLQTAYLEGRTTAHEVTQSYINRILFSRVTSGVSQTRSPVRSFRHRNCP